jgi:predicted DNA-binding transcriptional regulator AlpA
MKGKMMKTEMVQQGRTGERLLDVKQVAEILNCSPRQIWRMSGETGQMIKPLKLGGLRRWDRAKLDEWISSGCADLRKKGGSE